MNSSQELEPFDWKLTPERSMALLGLALLLIVAATYDQYGFSADEDRGFRRATRVWEFLSGAGKTVPSTIDMFHGAAPDVLALLAQKFVPALSFDSRHLVDALFGVAGIFFVYRIGREFVGGWAGFFSALFLALTPLWFGYMFMNHKDIPYATLLLASSYYSLRFLVAPRASFSLWIGASLAIGLLVATKAAGAAAVVVVDAIFILCLWLIPKESKLEITHIPKRLLLMTPGVFLGIVACFAIFWPHFYLFDPIEFGRFLTNKPHSGKTGLYAITHFLITTPIFLLVLGGIGFAAGLYNRHPAIIASALVFLFFFVLIWWTEQKVYNGSRHFLFVYPFFMIVAAYSLMLLLETRYTLAKLITLLLLGLNICTVIVQMYRLFPYQYSFYNEFVGGIRGAEGTYEIDGWRTAQREALRELAGLNIQGPAKVYSCGTFMDFAVQPGFQRTKVLEEADFVVSLRRGCPPERFPGMPLVSEIVRDGVIIARVFKTR